MASASLFSAVRRGDLGTIRALLFPGEAAPADGDDVALLSSSLPRNVKAANAVNPNYVDPATQTTALHQAVRRGDAVAAALLLRHSATNPVARDGESGWTPMHYAAYNGDVAMALLLSKSGGAGAERDKEGNNWADLLNVGLQSESNPMEMSTYEGAKPRKPASKAPQGVVPVQRLLPPSTKFLAPSAQTTPNHSDDDGSSSEDEDGPRSDSEFASLSSSPPRGKKRRHQMSEAQPAFSLWTWGANHNFLLGHPTPDSRTFPERLPALPTLTPASLTNLTIHLPEIREAKLAKYHAAIVTADGRLFVHGFGSLGRLGLGSDVNGSVLRPTQVPLPDAVKTVALGTDHTLVVLANGTLLSFGSNSCGQLGYSTPALVSGSGQMGPEWAPREVMKRTVVGVGAGKEHSACWTDSGAVYTWGKNNGMLGHLNLAPGALVASPRKVTSFHSPHVLQIECTAAATAILHAPTPQDRAVVVFSSNDAARVLFPVALSFPRTISQYTSSTQVRQQQRHNNSRLHRIVRLAAGNGQFAALTSAGEVFLWTPPGEQADPWLHATFPQSRPKRIWAVRNRAWLAARDVAVGIDSSILVATRSGHVYQGKRREKAKSRLPTAKKGEGETDMVFFKFGMVPSLQHTTRVAASTSGAFMALRVDERPGGGIIEGMGRLRREIGDLVGDEEADGDVLFAVEDGEAKAHRCVLAARSTFLRHLFEEAEDLNIGEKRDFEEGISVERLRDAEDWDGEGPSFKLTIAGCHHQSLLPLLQFTYSASFTKTWDHTAFSPEPGKKKGGKPQGPTPATIYADFRRLVKLFGLGDADAIQFSQEQDRISRDFGHALMSLVDLAAEPSRPSVFPDTVLRLSDRDVEVHQIVLVARCPFFAAMLGGGAGRWGLQRDDRGRISVGLTHLRWEVVRIVLAWMYADLDARALFADVAKPSVADLDEFVVEVLAAATELMLPQLKDLCCSILANTMDLRNVNSLLQTADMFDAEGLKDACLDFLCWNLELCIGTGMLNELGDELIEEISGRLRQLQTTKYPFIRGEDGYYAQVRREATRLEEERKARRRIDFVERRKLEELSRSLDDATISMLIANGAFDGPGPEASSRGDAASSESGDDVGHIDAGRLARSGSDRAMDRGGDDDIFDLEIDDGASSMGASSAKGKPPTATASSSSFSANWTRPLPAQAATVLATSPKTASASAMQSPRSEPPTTPSSKRVSKASWKRVDLATGKVVQDQPEPQPAPIAAAESKSPAAPKTWSVPLSTEKAKKTSLLDIMSETTTSTKVPSGAAPAKGQKSGISSTSSTPISGSVQAKTPPSAAAPSTPRMIKSHTWASSPSVPAANSPMASPPPTAMLTQQAHAGQGLASPVSLSLASTAAFVPSSGSQKDRRRNAKLQKVEPTLGIGQSGPKCWKGWAPVETPPPQPLMVQPPPPPSPAQLAARLREFPAIGNATSAPKDVRRERVW